MTPEFWIRTGAALMLAAVALGAFGAHALRSRLTPELLGVFETGVRWHVYHALGLIGLGAARGPGAAGWCFVAGVIVFSGSLYALALTGQRWLGAITPVGGALFLLGWAIMLKSVR